MHDIVNDYVAGFEGAPPLENIVIFADSLLEVKKQYHAKIPSFR